MTHWFGQTFRKTHILYVSPQWTKHRGEAFDPVKYADGLCSAAVDCVELYCKDHHGTCYFPCSLGLPYPRNVLGELLLELRKRQIRLIAYFSVCFDNYALGLHPEWRAVNYAGDPYKIGSFYMACLNSQYKAFALQQLRELASGYDVDGFWLDIIPLARDIPQSIWMTTPNPAPCYCLNCQQRYEQETGEPLPPRGHISTQQEDRAFRNQVDRVEAFLNDAYGVIREYHPDTVLTYNGAGSPGDPIKSGDLISIEGHAPEYPRQSFIARWAKNSGKPFEIMTAGGLPRFEVGGGWNGFDQKPSVILRLEAAIALAHGGSTLFGQAPYPNGAIDPTQFEGIGKVFRPLAELEPWLTQPQGVSDVGLVLAPKPRTASRWWAHMQDGAEAFLTAMLDGHHQFDFTRLDIRELAAYSLLILADQATLSDGEVETLREYVWQGGKLLASGNSSLWDERGQRRQDFALADVFGVSYKREPGYAFTYLKLRDETLIRRVTSLPIYADQPPLEVSLNGASVLAELVYPEAMRTDATTILWGDPAPDDDKRYPGICQHRFGKGVCWYVAVPLREKRLPNAWIKRLMNVLVDRAVDQPVLKTTAPPGVEVVLNRQAGRLVVHLVNYHAGDPDWLSFDDSAVVLHGLTVSLNLERLNIATVRQVYAPPAEPIQYRRADGWLEISVPPVTVHAMIIVEADG